MVSRAAVAAGAVLLLASCTAGGPATTTTPTSTSPTSTNSAGGPRHTTPSPTSPPGTRTSSTSRPEASARVSIAASGDLLTHVAVRRSAEAYAVAAGRYDFTPMFRRVSRLLTPADVALCHLETPLSSTNTDLSVPGTLVFNTPHELAAAVREAGYEGCDFASNHTWDRGLAGLDETIAVFADAELGYAGPGSTKGRPRMVATYAAPHATVAHLAYSYTILNDGSPNTRVPSQAPWLGSSLWSKVGAAGIRRDARAARAAGADFVVVSMHWGQEYVEEPTSDQRTLARELLGSDDVDLILGTHVHRVQPCEEINGKYVFYGLGNFLSNQSPTVNAGLLPQTQEGTVVRVALQRDVDGSVTSSARYQPTRVDLAGHVIVPATKATSAVTYARVGMTLNALGCNLRPLEP